MRFDEPDRWAVLKTIEGRVAYADDRSLRSSALGADVDQLLAESIRLSNASYVPLPLFVDPRFDTASLTTEYPSLSDRSRWRLVLLGHRRQSFPPFTLPLDIVAVGPLASKALTPFANESFVQEAIQNEAVTITALESLAYELDLAHQLPADADVVIAEGRDAIEIARRTDDRLPRLVIALDEAGECELKPPPNTAVVILRDPAGVMDVLMGIVHDQPLHASLPTTSEAVLYADPYSNHALRMADAFAAVARDALDDEISATKSAVEQGAIPEARPALSLEYNFVREGLGLLPMSRGKMALRKDAFEGAVPEPDSFEGQRRRVDARIERVGSVAPIDRYRAASSALWVPKNRALRRGGDYRLRLQIGRQVEGNLIPPDTPDLILPPTKFSAYKIDVALFPKDFTTSSPLRQTLTLPKGGASRPLWFDITAPVTAEKRAQLRFALYLGNQLLQSFLLTAALADEEAFEEHGLDVRLELAKSEAFANLDALEAHPRAASIGVNLDADGLHTLCLKLNDAVREHRFSGKAFEKPQQDLRAILEAAAQRNHMPVFPADDQPLTAQQKDVFEQTVRSLAAIGDEIHAAIFGRLSDIRDLLRELMNESDKPLSFSRFDVNFTIPWPVLYDFTIPADPAAAVCRGRAADGTACGHGPGAGVYCLHGFWGIRHVIDESLATEKRRDASQSIEAAAGMPLMRASDAPDDGFCQALVNDLDNIRPGVASRIEPQEHVLDLLWTANTRPAVMMFLGHLDDLNARRIETAGTLKWLTAKDLGDRARLNAGWTPPNTLVFLMACAAMQLTPETLTDHALALSSAGASAVVGPECTIFPAFACRFVREIVLAMLNDPKATLGRAMSEFRRRTVTAGNPLAFAFTSFGEADVSIR